MQKNIIITGVSRGIGLELVKILAKTHQILAISRNTEPVKYLDNVQTLDLDLSELEELGKAATFVQTHWKKVDIIIHNAGQLIHKPFAQTGYQDFLHTYNVNVFAVAELTRLLLPFLKKGSHIVSISSIGGIQGSVKFPGLAAYSSSKGALITLTELLAEEYKEQGIACNVLALGAVQTEMLKEAFPDYKAPISAGEMARYIAEFALSGNTYFNGKVLPVASSTP